MKELIEFLAELRRNNNRDWFEANRELYRKVSDDFNRFTEGLIAGIARFDPSVAGLTVKDCTYRIYRDVRFSPNKEPYKTHMGAYVCPQGKKSGMAGYYFHVEPQNESGTGGHLISVGLYMPDPEVLRNVREDILDNGDKLAAAIRKAKTLTLERSNALKRTPTGFPTGSPYDDLLKLKDICLNESLPEELVTGDDLLARVLEKFASTRDFVRFLNEAR